MNPEVKNKVVIVVVAIVMLSVGVVGRSLFPTTEQVTLAEVETLRAQNARMNETIASLNHTIELKDAEIARIQDTASRFAQVIAGDIAAIASKNKEIEELNSQMDILELKYASVLVDIDRLENENADYNPHWWNVASDLKSMGVTKVKILYLDTEWSRQMIEDIEAAGITVTSRYGYGMGTQYTPQTFWDSDDSVGLVIGFTEGAVSARDMKGTWYGIGAGTLVKIR